MATTTYTNGITITIERLAPDSEESAGKWDFKVTGSHPRLATTREDFVSGGWPAAFATESRIVSELSALL